MPDPGWIELQPIGEYQQDVRRWYPFDQQVDQLPRRRVEPVEILHHHKNRLPGCHDLNDGDQCLQCLGHHLARWEGERGVSALRRNREQCGEYRPVITDLHAELSQQFVDLVEACPRIVALVEP